jgi:hypothetical protein
MYAHERSLVERYKSRPFVLLGVNADPDREEARALAAKQGMTWRSWWDDGRIATQWRVQFWPSVFLLDGRGNVRFTNLRGRELEHAIESLLREAESGERS